MKTRILLMAILFMWVYVGYHQGYCEQRLQVKPKSFSFQMLSEQQKIEIIEVKNISEKYVSVKSEFDSSWISIYPSQFILLPSQKQRVLVIFSTPSSSPENITGKIRFHTGGTFEEVSVTMTALAGNLTSENSEKTNTEQRNTPPQSEEKSRENPTGFDVQKVSNPVSAPPARKKERAEIPKNTESAEPPAPGKKTHKDSLLQSLRNQIKELEAKLRQSDQELNELTQQIKLHDQRILELLPQLSNDMIQDLRDLYAFLQKYFHNEIQDETAHLEWNGDQIVLSIDGNLTFASGSTRLEAKGEALIAKIAHILKTQGKYEKVVTVVGHADGQPISYRLKPTIPSNWELSSLRAATVVRQLDEKLGFKGENLALEAYAHYRPIADNSTEKGRRQNRRIEFIVSTLANADVRKTLAKTEEIEPEKEN